jgi:hypothetical protein
MSFLIELKKLENLVNSKVNGAQPILIVMRGSQVYGTNLPNSDTDYCGIYIQSLSDILGNRYKEQISDDKNDTVFYEVSRFLELLEQNNPNILEIVNTPDEFIMYKDPIFDLILDKKDQFLTKKCSNTFGGYGVQQISKAKGQNKKVNWENDRMVRKSILDFCYILDGEKSKPFREYVELNKLDISKIGAVNIPNAQNCFALYYDSDSNKGYFGVVGDEEKSNQLRLSSIPKGETPFCTIVYNSDSYTQHCKDYKSYTEWLENRNESRWVDVEEHNQKIDGKNMMHCVRLLRMAKEISEGLGVIVERPDAEYLLSIRKGKVNLETIIEESELMIKSIRKLFDNSNLPNSVDPNLVNSLLIDIRSEFYGLVE